MLTEFWTCNSSGNPVIRIGNKEYERMCEELEQHFNKKKIPEWLQNRDVTELMGHRLERTGNPRGLHIENRLTDKPE